MPPSVGRCRRIAACSPGFCRRSTTDRRRQWAIAGAALGLTHYGFEAGRWFFTPLAILWLVHLACTGTPMRARRRGLAVLAIAFTAAALPVYVAALLHGKPLAPRLAEAGSIGDAGLAEIVRRVASGFAVYANQPDTSRFYFGDSALILAPLLPLFALGVAVLLYPPAGCNPSQSPYRSGWSPPRSAMQQCAKSRRTRAGWLPIPPSPSRWRLGCRPAHAGYRAAPAWRRRRSRSPSRCCNSAITSDHICDE